MRRGLHDEAVEGSQAQDEVSYWEQKNEHEMEETMEDQSI